MIHRQCLRIKIVIEIGRLIRKIMTEEKKNKIERQREMERGRDEN